MQKSETKEVTEYEFEGELPIVESRTPARPRIHISDNNCISCEG